VPAQPCRIVDQRDAGGARLENVAEQRLDFSATACGDLRRVIEKAEVAKNVVERPALELRRFGPGFGRRVLERCVQRVAFVAEVERLVQAGGAAGTHLCSP
jgi:hypothetical protein